MSLKEAQIKRKNVYTFKSNSQTPITIPAVAGNQALPSVTIPADALEGRKIKAAYCHMKYAKARDSSTADNKLSGNQYIQVKESVSGSYTNAILLVDDMIFVDVSESTVIGGDIIYGNIDVKAQVSAENLTFNFQWTSALADGASLLLDDVEMIIEVWVY